DQISQGVFINTSVGPQVIYSIAHAIAKGHVKNKAQGEDAPQKIKTSEKNSKRQKILPIMI
ncbi:hypothetical protein ACQWF6_24875, partial [Salmonella enterica subsp. enterica serovar Infantis]